MVLKDRKTFDCGKKLFTSEIKRTVYDLGSWDYRDLRHFIDYYLSTHFISISIKHFIHKITLPLQHIGKRGSLTRDNLHGGTWWLRA